MEKIYIVFAFAIIFHGANTLLAQKNCDKLGVRVYEDMGCTPKYNRCNRQCPEEFCCPHLHESSTQCYYKNLTLQIGESVKHPDQFCDVACFCDKPEGGEPGESTGTRFICAVIDCAEYFGITPPPGCYRTYDLKSCCSSGEICGGSKVTCRYGGETYKEGTRFFPKDSCSMCACKKGFRGKIEAPFCTRRKCNVQLRDLEMVQQKCAPVYHLYGGSDTNSDILCCPSRWVCPNGNEKILGTGISNKICYFGDLTMKVGQKIDYQIGSTSPVTCECNIPPLLTCVPKK